MSKLVESEANLTYTENGCLAYANTKSAVLDFFSTAGSMRGFEAIDKQLLFKKALEEDAKLALKALVYLYDIRKGQGERQLFFDIVSNLLKESDIDADTKIKLIKLIPEFGRWDMLVKLLSAIDKADRDSCTTIYTILDSIRAAIYDGNALCKKWMPRKGKEANRIRGFMELTPKEWRKCLVTGYTTEQDMSANKWDNINYEHVPSKCMKNNYNAFRRHSPERYEKYEEDLSKGEVKVNTSTLYPYEIIAKKTDDYHGENLDNTLLAMWYALPDYMEGKKVNILPMVDVSGSMSCPVSPSSSVYCMSVAISLGIYTAERNNGEFKNELITFTDIPEFIHFDEKDDLNARIDKCMKDVGYNTNIELAFTRLLDRAVRNNIPKDEMPSMMLVLSDMQFDDTSIQGKTMDEALVQKYKDAGYDMPILVYWNLRACLKNGFPAMDASSGRILISGFSPSILKPILQMDFNSITPYALMLKVLNQPRYDLF